MLGVLNIVNKYFWKSWSGPFFTFIITPLIMILSMAMIPIPTVIQANALSLPIICTGLTVLPSTIFEFKSSAILKRIGVANVKPFVFVMAIVIYFSTFMILATALNLVLAMIYIYLQYGNNHAFGHLDFYSAYKSADYISWAYVQVVVMLMSLSLGFMSASIFRSVLAIQTFGIALIMFTMFLGGTFASITMVEAIPGLNWVSYFLPYRYTSALSVEAWFSNIGQLIKEYSVKITPPLKIGSALGVLQWLANNKEIGTNFVLGHYVSGVFKEISFADVIAFKVRADQAFISIFDVGKGFIYHTNCQAIIDASKNHTSLTLHPDTSLFNFYKSSVWDLKGRFAQLGTKVDFNVRQAVPKIVDLSLGLKRIIYISMPYVFTATFFGISAINFRWNYR